MVFLYRGLVFLLLSALGSCSIAFAFSSVNVPLGDWSYDALDKLEGFGLVHSALHGTRPYSRLEMARLIHEAHEEKDIQGIKLPPVVEDLLRDLDRAFKEELLLVGKTTDILQKSFIKPLSEVQARYVYVQGQPREFLNVTGGVRQYPKTSFGIKATEGTPLVYNNEGLVYGEHNNFSLQFSSILGYRDFFSAYVEPFVLLRQNEGDIINLDGTPFAQAKLDVLKGYGMLTLWDMQLEAGRDSMWWGQGTHGDTIMTNNAFPLDMIKLSNPEPIVLPWLFKYLGLFKYAFFYSKLMGYEVPPNPNLTGFRINFKPTSCFEMGFSATVQTGGEGIPNFDWLDMFRFFSFKSLPNARGLAAVDFRWKIPFLRDTQVYLEYGGADTTTYNPSYPTELIFRDNAWMIGTYIPRLTADGRTDLRVEYTLNAFRVDPPKTGMWYGHSQYRSGYVHNDVLMGHHMGPDADDLFTRLTYYLTNTVQLGLDYDYMGRGYNLSNVTERANQFGADLTWNLCERTLMLTARYGFESVNNYNMQEGDNRRNQVIETAIKLQF